MRSGYDGLLVFADIVGVFVIVDCVWVLFVFVVEEFAFDALFGVSVWWVLFLLL